MAITSGTAHPGVYLLGDHLDSALACGEDLLKEKVALIDVAQTPSRAHLLQQSQELNAFLCGVRTLELAMTARLLEARKRATDLKRQESWLRPMLALFVAGTVPLMDAAAELGDTTVRDFDTGGTASAFLRSRGLIAPDAAGLERLTQLALSEEYLVMGRLRLGTLLDLIATTLDALDTLFDLYPEEATIFQAGPRPPRPRAPSPYSGPSAIVR
jgi:hypothetical protein